MAVLIDKRCPCCGHQLTQLNLWYGGEGWVLSEVCDNRWPACEYQVKVEEEVK